MTKSTLYRSFIGIKRMSFLLICSLLILCSNGYAQVQTQRPVYKKISKYINAFYESLPVDYNENPSAKYPLIIFIHGKGEMGNGSSSAITKVLRTGIPYLIAHRKFPTSFKVDGKQYSFIVISPQITTNAYSQSGKFINELLQYCKQAYRIDESRIYITGLSMGGGMTWKAVSDEPETFAAAIPICGSLSSSNDMARSIAKSNLPLWAIHNEGDPVVSVKVTRGWESKLKAHKATPYPRITIFNSKAHDAWSKSYDPNFKINGQNIYQWLLSYTRRSVLPVAVAGPDQVLETPLKEAWLDGNKSYSPNDKIKTFKWSLIKGSSKIKIATPNKARTKITGLTAGSYQFELQVNDTKGRSSVDYVTLTVSAAAIISNLKADAGADQIITLPNNDVTLNASNSGSTNSKITGYTWIKIKGPQATIVHKNAAKTTVKNLAEGEYEFRVLVKDDLNAEAADTVKVTVKTPPPPIARAGSDQTVTLPQNSVTLNASGSTSQYSRIIKYEWQKVSGPKAIFSNKNRAKTTVKNLVEGRYTFSVTVTNEFGGKNTDQVIVTVKPAQHPIAEAGQDQTITLPNNIITLDASISSAPGSEIVKYEWQKTSGPKAKIVNPNKAKTEVKNLVEGTYTFSITVTNKHGEKASDVVNVTVHEKVKEVAKPSGKGPNAALTATKETITLPQNEITLNGYKSKTTEGRIIKYEWKKVSGGAAKIQKPTNPVSKISGLKQGVYRFSLKVTTDHGKWDTVSVVVTVKPSAAKTSSRIAGVQEQDAELMVAGSSSEEDLKSALLTTGINNSITTYPNPFNSELTVRIRSNETGLVRLQLFDASGKMVQQEQFPKTETFELVKTLQVHALTPGIYFIKISIGNTLQKSIQVMKK